MDLFVHFSTDSDTLQNGDVQRFIEDNGGVQTIRQFVGSVAVEREGLLAKVCERITANIRADDPNKIAEDMSKAFALEAEAVDTLCFLNTDKNIIFADRNESQLPNISPLFDGIKKAQFDKDWVEFVPLQAISTASNGNGETRLVPIVKVKNGPVTHYRLKALISGYTIIRAKDSTDVALERLRVALRRALFLFEKCATSANFATQDFIEVQCYAFLCEGNIICVCYPRSDDEALLRGFRAKLHKILNLSFDRPLLRASQAISFESSSRLLRDPHLYISNYKPKGELSLVKGHYDYHHYMQDGVDDTGWGCAYRSLQSIWSWLILQGHTDKPVPTHRQIQESLYECGDKDAKFVGSRQWIGSMELSYCLNNMLGLESRIISTNSGAEIADNVRQLAQHFKNSGAPVMIGGGMLAHTILGVDFNDLTGECAFLVLDPHYAGEEDISTVVSKGWCGWKAPSFWKQDDFYNMLLPMPPTNVI
ncbi:putative Ufm1-specific protease [Toxocara canis]|uniref:Ufm1-specific protease n=1 Tax=Toxocara canis TaxID=6265 RepID=A0A0B2VAF7_TOXCA|nr:putative Ufm1-specific protease [Toxocara canis]